MVHKGHRDLRAVTQWDFLSAEGGREAPRSCLAKEGWPWPSLATAHSRCVVWNLKAPKHWAEDHTHLQAKPCQLHIGRGQRKACRPPAVAHTHVSHHTLVQIQYQDRAPPPNLRLGSEAPASLAGRRRAKAATKGWREWSAVGQKPPEHHRAKEAAPAEAVLIPQGSQPPRQLVLLAAHRAFAHSRGPLWKLAELV